MIVRMKNVKQAQTYLYRVVLDTVSDVNVGATDYFGVEEEAPCKGEVYLVGENMKINAKSLLGAHMARVAWDELYVEADFDCYHTFEKFII